MQTAQRTCAGPRRRKARSQPSLPSACGTSSHVPEARCKRRLAASPAMAHATRQSAKQNAKSCKRASTSKSSSKPAVDMAFSISITSMGASLPITLRKASSKQDVPGTGHQKTHHIKRKNFKQQSHLREKFQAPLPRRAPPRRTLLQRVRVLSSSNLSNIQCSNMTRSTQRNNSQTSDTGWRRCSKVHVRQCQVRHLLWVLKCKGSDAT